MNQFLRNLPPLGQLLFFVVFSFLSAGLFSMLAVILSASFFNLSMEEFANNFDFYAPENLDIAILFTTMNAVGLFLLPALTFASFLSNYPYDFLKISSTPKRKIFLFSLLVMVLSYPLINYTYALNLLVELPRWMMDEEALREDLINNMVVQKSLLQNILVLALLPAFAEELFFRGIAQRLVTKIFRGNIHLAILFVAIVFSALHMQFAGFLPRAFMGIVLGYVYAYSHSLWPGIFIHFLNNATAIILASLMVNNPNLEAIDTFSSEINLVNTLIALVCSVGLFFLLKQIKITATTTE
ncbi:MAG: CPBP family intramembrane glutamic endopeptidase [Bacteroidia bacterium]